ncbi:hypothetical protein N869_00650 [Cellulomonas bogoriensis 69B4 = DSM 16987]|uniref:PH domain-containing protein n=1 Tax=Cellulomonas bogoriensis 69B4 = DSM 16987 TaxID=1386082 RepID=A0A0A0C2R0_9CELL|nr:hypothetical protein N869_00650 [Cellulomonas bogoriensis 69B4 = DSM 16987]
MPLGWAVLLLGAVFAGSLWAMRSGWRRREARTAAAVPAPPPVPTGLGEPLHGPVDVTYVTSTTAGDRYDRVVAHDLGATAPATVEVHPVGVHLARSSVPDLFVPREQIVSVGTAAGMVGKYPGRGRLLVLTWRTASDGPAIDTGLHTPSSHDRAALAEALAALITPAPAPLPEEQS